MAAKHAKSATTEEGLMMKLRIHHKPKDLPETWPLHLRKTFQNIRTLSSVEYQAYDENVPAEHGTITWRRDIKLRAKQLSDTAQRLLRESPSELTWRLELEILVDARFRLNTECSICSNTHHSGRVWRSEIEVVTECNGPITKDLESRRARRAPCQCDETTYTGLNRYFSNRADQTFHYRSDLSSPQGLNNITKRRPDRVYGLRQTTNFEKRLEQPARRMMDENNENSIAEVIGLISPNREEKLVQDFIQATPFTCSKEPLLFPFLIMEAKSEKGGGFSRCGIQTSLPIWSLLRSQERLSELGTPLSELGGPIVWYMAYVGDNWRISGCCTAKERDQQTYQIIDLWDGRISSPDGALQVLLIMDYIFDWARDLYRPSILRSLEAFGDQNYDDSASVTADSDIISSWKHPLDDRMSLEPDADIEILEIAPTDKSLLQPWEKYDLESCRGICIYDLRAFRPSYVIETAFHCLNITGDNIGTLIASVGRSPQNHMKMARDALAALRASSMVLNDRILTQIEHTWTGTIRPSQYSNKDIKKFCSIAYRTTISDAWKLKRAIVCFSVDQRGLDILRQHAKFQRKVLRLENLENTGQVIDENAVASILQYLQNRDHRDILSNALANIHEIWKSAKQLTELEHQHIGPVSDGDIILAPQTYGGVAIASIVYGTYNRHKQPGLLEPDYPYLRFSARLDLCNKSSPPSNTTILPLHGVEQPAKIGAQSSILVCNQNRNGNNLCVFSLEIHQNPPTFADIISALVSAVMESHFFIMNRWNAYHQEEERRRKTFYTPTVEAEDPLIPIIRVAACRWLLKLCNTFDKGAFENFEHLFEADTLFEALDGYLEIGRGQIRYQEQHPFARPQKDRSPKRIKTSHASETVTDALDSGAGSSPGYTVDKEIDDILAQANGDGLTDDQINVLMQLGYFT